MSNTIRYNSQDLTADHSRIMAPVPLYRPQPVGWQGFTSMPDGTVVPRTWSCSCGTSPAATPYGVKPAENTIIDPTRAYVAELNCSGAPTTCVDPRAITYLQNGQPAEHLSCVYATAISPIECSDSRTPEAGCFRYPFRTSVD